MILSWAFQAGQMPCGVAPKDRKVGVRALQLGSLLQSRCPDLGETGLGCHNGGWTAEQRLVLCGSRQARSLSEPPDCQPPAAVRLLAFVLQSALGFFRSVLAPPTPSCCDWQRPHPETGGAWDSIAGQLPPHAWPWILQPQDE